MLVEFSVKNFTSIGDKQTISFVGSKIKNHSNHIINEKEKILMYLGVYGANSSGKSNLIDAINLVKKILVRGTSFITEFNYKNDKNKPISEFSYILKIDKKKYLYSYKINSLQKEITEESLYDITRKNKKVLFDRNLEKTTYKFGSNIKKRSIFAGLLEEMKDNKRILFLGEIKNRISNMDLDDEEYVTVNRIYSFFLYDMIYFSSKNTNLITANYIRRKESILSALKLFDINVKDIVEEKTNIEFLSEKVSKSTFLKIINIVTNSDVNYFTLRINNYLFSLKTDDEDIEVYRIKFIYDDYEEYKLSLGAIKIIELVYILISKNKLFLIDDFDYSLHPIVSRKFLELFFKIKNKNQIITVGHESNNLDFNIVRRDEIWFSEKKEEGTVLFPLENFKTERFDKKISKAYLNGEYGAIPKEIEDEKPKVIILKNDYRKKKSS